MTVADTNKIVSLLIPSKQLFPVVGGVFLCDIILLTLLHPENAFSPMLVTVFGISTEVRLEHP